MAYDPTYYQNQRDELNKEYSLLVVETYVEIERQVMKKLQKQQELEKKLAALEKKEKESKEQKEVKKGNKKPS